MFTKEEVNLKKLDDVLKKLDEIKALIEAPVTKQKAQKKKGEDNEAK